MKSTVFLIILLLGLAGVSTPVSDAAAEVAVVFTQDEVRIITSWYREHGSAPRGHGKGRGHNGLPPGIAKNLARGKALPPGIAKQRLPAGLVSVLPAPPRGYERVVVDGRVLLVEVATQLIHDALIDIVLD